MTGSFELPLPPGDYVIRVEPIRASFVAGSGVGQYARDNQDIAFHHRIDIKLFDAPVVRIMAGNKKDVGVLKCPDAPPEPK